MSEINNFIIDEELQNIFKNLSKISKYHILKFLKSQAVEEKNKVENITPHNKKTNGNHMKDAWQIYSGQYGSTIFNTKKTQVNGYDGSLAFITNNKKNTKTFRWFNNWWAFEKMQLNEKIGNKVDKIVQKIIKKGK